MRETIRQFTARDGLVLRLYQWRSDTEEVPRAVIQIAHGMGEHAARYARLAEALCAQGYAVYAHDLRGHGGTATGLEAHGDMGLDGWNRCVEDLHELGEAIANWHPGVARVLLGHSMGSFLAQQYLTEHGDSLDALALSGSNDATGGGFWFAVLRLLARFERWRLGPRGQSPLLGAAVFGSFNRRIENPRTDFDWLSRDPHEVDRYIADPLCGFMLRSQSLLDMWDGLAAAGKPHRLARIPKQLPIYVFSGDQDPVNDQLRGLRRLLARYADQGLEHVTHRFYAGGRHEMFNEKNRGEVTDDFLKWLAEDVVSGPR